MNNTPLNDELKATVEKYHNIGIPVLPFKIGIDGKKRPAIEAWSEWQHRSQTPEEFGAILPKIIETQVLGLVMGTKIIVDGEICYFIAVDRDTKDPTLTEEIKKKSKLALNAMRITQTEGTIHGGEHLYYYSKLPAKGKKLHDIGMELLGTGNLCVVFPSIGYSKLNDNTPTVIESAEDAFYDAIEKVGLSPKRNQTSIRKLLSTPKKYNRKPIRPCFVKLIGKQHLEHLEKVALIYELHYCGRTDQEIYDIFHENKAWEMEPDHQYNEVHTDEQLTYTINKAQQGNYRYLKETLTQMNICFPDCPLIQKIDCRKNKQNGKDGINPISDVAKFIEKSYQFAVEKNTNLLYVYDPAEGIYTNKTEHIIKTEICKLLDDETRVKYFAEVDNWLRSNPQTPRVEFNTDKNILAVKNGILHLDSLMLENFSPKFYITNKIPHEYARDADCQPIKRFLEASMPNKNHQLQHQEFLGKIIGKENPHHHEYGIMQGEGNNGKSVLIDVDTYFLGKENVSNQTLQALIYDKFATAALKDKFANFCADLPSTMLKHMGIINMIAAGDEITSQVKYGDLFKWKPNIGMMFSCNEAPAIDPSEDHAGTYRRIMIWDFPIIFSPNDPEHPEDKTLRDKLCTETLMSGYLNYAIEGLKRLKEQADFTAKLPIQETRKAYIKRSDSCRAFAIEHVIDTDNENDVVLSDYLFRKYIAYCVANKLSRRSKGELTKAIRCYAPGAEQTKTKLNPSDRDSPRVTSWRFLKMSDMSNMSEVFPKGSKENYQNKTLELSETPQTTLPTLTNFNQSNVEIANSPAQQGKKSTKSSMNETIEYEQIVCYFCRKPIMENDWEQNGFTENKPGHKKCCDELRSQLKRPQEDDNS